MYRHHHLSIILILLYTSFSQKLHGQHANYNFLENISLNTEASVVGCFVQDTQGLIWIGSDKGLFSYDGYSTQPHFTFGHPSNTRIYCGTAPDDCHLYLGADNGLLIYNYRTDCYEEPPAKFPTDIRAMTIYQGLLWLGTLNGLYTYHLTEHTLADASNGLPHPTIYSLLPASDGNLYIGTYNGCCRYNRETGKFESISLPATTGKSNIFVNSLLEDTLQQCIWVGTEGNLYQYVPLTGKTSRMEAFNGNSIKSLALDGYDQLLIGTDNGLYVYREDAPLRHIVHDSRNNRSLSNNIIWNIFSDREQNIWLGTDNGISLSHHNHAMQHISISQITGTGEGNRFYTLLHDTHHNFWLGGTNGLIRIPLSKNKKSNEQQPIIGNHDIVWYKMGNLQHPLSHNRIRRIYEDREQQIWIATDGSINRYDPKTGQFIHYTITDSTHRYNANWAYDLFEDNEGRLWIATCLGGIFVVDKQKLNQSAGKPYVAEQTYSIQNGLSGMFVNQMTADHDGNIWVLLYNSPVCIEKINPRTGKITHITTDKVGAEQTPNVLLCADDGHIWIGYSGGVMQINSSTETIRVLPFGTNSHHEVLSMAEADGKIWISTNDGLWVADGQTQEVRRLNITDKRFTGMYYDPATKRFYLGTTDGISVVQPTALLTEPSERPLLLTSLSVNGKSYSPLSTENTPASCRYIRDITLKHNQNNLSFEFSDLPYSLEERNKFTYYLDGFEQTWNLLPHNVRHITYNNLPYGDYLLKVCRLNAYNLPSEEVYTLDVHIAAPWYYTPWAKTGYVLLALILGGWTVNFFRVRNRLRMERLEKEKILEQSKNKMELFTNLAHDLKNPLSLILAPVSQMMLNAESPQKKKQLEQIRTQAMKLNSLIHWTLDIHRVDSGNNMLIILSQIELVSFARSLYQTYSEEHMKPKRLHFEFICEKKEIYIQMDAVKLGSILENLLSNAVKYTPEGGTITLSIRQPEDYKHIVIEVRDTGIGIPLQDQPHIFQRFFQSSTTAGIKEGTGIGLYLVKTYTELHGGSVKLVSAEGEGASFTLTLPVGCDIQSIPQPVNDSQPEEEQTPEEEQLQATETGSATDITYENEPADAPMILIVDDSREVTEFIYQVLHAKYRCRIASNGKEGLELAASLPADLIISDVMMPVMDGLEMVRRLKKQIPTSTIPVILLTACSGKETELESIRMHVDAFIAKPFEPNILLLRVQQLLYNSHAYETKARLEAIASPKEIEVASPDEKLLFDVTRLIEEHIDNSELNVNALCRWTTTGNKQMYRKIKQLTGMTPVEYIKSIRLKKAAMLLKQQKFTISEVMYMVGFSNPSYFSKCFQGEFGTTPKQYVATNSKS